MNNEFQYNHSIIWAVLLWFGLTLNTPLPKFWNLYLFHHFFAHLFLMNTQKQKVFSSRNFNNLLTSRLQWSYNTLH